jgi:lipoprotein signal peptidase
VSTFETYLTGAKILGIAKMRHSAFSTIHNESSWFFIITVSVVILALLRHLAKTNLNEIVIT